MVYGRPVYPQPQRLVVGGCRPTCVSSTLPCPLATDGDAGRSARLHAHGHTHLPLPSCYSHTHVDEADRGGWGGVGVGEGAGGWVLLVRPVCCPIMHSPHLMSNRASPSHHPAPSPLLALPRLPPPPLLPALPRPPLTCPAIPITVAFAPPPLPPQVLMPSYEQLGAMVWVVENMAGDLLAFLFPCILVFIGFTTTMNVVFKWGRAIRMMMRGLKEFSWHVCFPTHHPTFPDVCSALLRLCLSSLCQPPHGPHFFPKPCAHSHTHTLPSSPCFLL